MIAESLTTDLTSRTALPRKNGELVFAAPWESRAFGVAVTLCERGFFQWDEFRERLMDEIAAFDREHPDGAGFSYYNCWLAALERLLLELHLCHKEEIGAATIAPAG